MSSDQFQQLSIRLDRINARLNMHDKRFDQVDSTIEKLYLHMEQRFSEVHDEMDQRFNKVEAQLDRVLSMLDEDLKRRETDEQERLIITHQLDQHEEWIELASSELNVKYNRAG